MSNINRLYGNVFIHVPKVAGTSMEIKPFVGGDSHASAKLLKEVIGDEGWNRLFTWGFVRNPLERFVSAFFHEPRTHGFQRNTKGFREFVYFMHKMGLDIKGSLTGSGHHHHHFVPQHYFLCDSDDNILVDFVGRFSNLEHDWNNVCENIERHSKMPIEMEDKVLTHERASGHAHYTSYYSVDEKLISMVKELYAKDYEIFKDYLK